MDIATWDILKWVLLVLLAGFIGQFGKSFAQAVMAGIRKKKAADAASPERAKPSAAVPGSSDPTALPDPEGAGGPGPGRAVEEQPSFLPAPGAEPPAAIDREDKKSLKTLAKQQKKEAKLRSKLMK